MDNVPMAISCYVNRQCLDGRRRDTLRTGVPIPSEISSVVPLESNGTTERVAF